MPTYVAGDVRSIQEYIFGSPRLLEMRGASALIDFFDRAAVPALVTRFLGELVFSGGGNFLARFDSEDRAGGFTERIHNAFFELTGSDGITLASLTCEGRSREDAIEIARRLRRAKRSAAGSRQLASMPFLKRCESCGREGADVSLPVPGAAVERRQWVGPICARKHRMLRELRELGNQPPSRGRSHAVHGVAKGQPIPVVTERLRGARLPAHFQELAGEGDLALVVADGNGLGEWFDRLDFDGIRQLSKTVDAELRSALDAAVDAAFPGDPHPSLQVLICGGDDLVVALPARKGMAFATALIAAFEVTSPRVPGLRAGLAAGLLFAKPSFPFRQAHALADSLLGRAKACCRSKRVLAALDFYRVKATQVQSLGQERAAVERVGKDAPAAWSYGAAGPYTPEELEALRDLAGRLRRVSPSQRGRLREILSPRDDGRETPLDPAWGVPRRVVAELQTWLLRQEGERPFQAVPGEPPQAGLVRPDAVERGGERRVFQRLILSDALLLAEQGEE
ncbi:MAG TPA: hypothetical protein VFR03_12505 [Thermoanaerobaculia bacterium]|nr:hypothetical protein [Thermoanaerobaculia bacterium]